MKTWLFWDAWHLEHQDNVGLQQGRPEWIPGATYEDPNFDYLGCWPCVYRDAASGMWRMLYIVSGFPLSVMGAESEDGIHWRPMDRPDIGPGGEKLAPHHLFTVKSANGGLFYLDPVATDGNPFKLWCVQRGGPVAERAKHAPSSYFHEMVTGEGVKPWMADNLVAVSKDGLHWEIDEGATWNIPGWHPDPACCGFYNPISSKHMMLTRPGWGDRRLAMIDSDDARTWGNLRLIMQPDASDPMGTQFYGMPVHRYENAFVGFLWMAHFDNAQRLERFNQLHGDIDCQLAWSVDGEHWQRGVREPFIATNPLGQPGAGVVYPTSLVDRDDELLIYSASTPDLHHQHTDSQFVRKGEMPPSSIIAHRLRRDGFMYLRSKGNFARFITKPLVLLKPELTINAQAPHGEILFQLTDLTSTPLEDFTFDDCVPFTADDQLRQPVRWKNKSLDEVTNRILRLEVRFRNANIYAFRGDFHFADALDVALTEDDHPIDADFMDH